MQLWLSCRGVKHLPSLRLILVLFIFGDVNGKIHFDPIARWEILFLSCRKICFSQSDECLPTLQRLRLSPSVHQPTPVNYAKLVVSESQCYSGGLLLLLLHLLYRRLHLKQHIFPNRKMSNCQLITFEIVLAYHPGEILQVLQRISSYFNLFFSVIKCIQC